MHLIQLAYADDVRAPPNAIQKGTHPATRSKDRVSRLLCRQRHAEAGAQRMLRMRTLIWRRKSSSSSASRAVTILLNTRTRVRNASAYKLLLRTASTALHYHYAFLEALALQEEPPQPKDKTVRTMVIAISYRSKAADARQQ
jgi:hypothetical protein